jgi:hypothetical protein
MLKTLPDSAAAAGADPLRYNVDLPFRATFHPMGYAVEVSSNSAHVVSVAAKLWQRYPRLSDAQPVRIHIIAGGPQPDSPRHRTRPRGEAHLFSIVHGPHDFAVADLSAGFAFASLSEESISDPSGLVYYFLEPLAYAMLGARSFVFIHASCISRDGKAIVLCGASGSGKTCLAYACARRGWDYVSGDAVHIVRARGSRTVIGRPYEIRFRESAMEIFPELARWPAEVRPNGKIDLEIDAEELGISTSLRCSARHIVFIERNNLTWLEPFACEQALRNLRETICYGGQQTRGEQHEALADFASLPCWRLCYSDLDKAERTLERLLDEE